MKPLKYSEIVRMHVELFGVEPIITGVNFRDSDELIDKILQAIEDNIPYVEKDVENGVLT